MSPLEYLTVAKILRTHGLKGEVAVANLTATSLSFLKGANVWLVPPPTVGSTFSVTSVRTSPRSTLLRFSEIRSIDAAADLVGREILADASIVPVTDPGPDEPPVTGFRVDDDARGEIGIVTDTIITGANDVWVVHGRFGEVLVPVIDEVVKQIVHDTRTIQVRLLEGLLPDEEDS